MPLRKRQLGQEVLTADPAGSLQYRKVGGMGGAGGAGG